MLIFKFLNVNLIKEFVKEVREYERLDKVEENSADKIDQSKSTEKKLYNVFDRFKKK